MTRDEAMAMAISARQPGEDLCALADKIHRFSHPDPQGDTREYFRVMNQDGLVSVIQGLLSLGEGNNKYCMSTVNGTLVITTYGVKSTVTQRAIWRWLQNPARLSNFLADSGCSEKEVD